MIISCVHHLDPHDAAQGNKFCLSDLDQDNKGRTNKDLDPYSSAH